MTIFEFQIQLDLDKRNRLDLLKEHASKIEFGYFFVDTEDGQCYLFDENGKLDDVKKIMTFYKGYAKKDTKKIVVPNCIECIRYQAFAHCTSLTSIEIPESVESIEDWAFYNCTSLEEVIFKGKTIDQVKEMGQYQWWGIKDKSIIKCEKS